MEINFTDFIIEQSKIYNEFFDYWHENHKKDPDKFPTKLTKEVWKSEIEKWSNKNKI